MAKYNNPPIMEAVCEIKFGKDTKWDITIPGIIYNEVMTEFPHKEQHAIQEVNVSSENNAPTKKPMARTQIRTINLARFLSVDKKAMIQVGERVLLVSRLTPYQSWSDFNNHIRYAFKVLSQKVIINSIQRIGLRYINRIVVPKKDMRLDDYFEFRPFLGEGLRKPYTSFIVGCIFPFNNDNDSCKVELSQAVAESNDVSAFMLDIDYSLSKPQSIEVNQSLEWVDKAHEEIEGIFESCISRSLRELFGEVK
jgi:uncharacterized protein (TIGR04255 family)